VHAQCTHAHTAGFDEDGLMRTAMGWYHLAIAFAARFKMVKLVH
jgi:hypothetical protein